MSLVASAVLLVGLAVAGLVLPRVLRDLRSARDAEALREWKHAAPETKTAIRAAWGRGSAVTESAEARVAVAMSDHVDRVEAATNRVVLLAFAPVAPGLILAIASLGVPRVVWAIVAVPPVAWLAFYPVVARSRARRHRSVDLTKQQHTA